MNLLTFKDELAKMDISLENQHAYGYNNLKDLLALYTIAHGENINKKGISEMAIVISAHFEGIEIEDILRLLDTMNEAIRLDKDVYMKNGEVDSSDIDWLITKTKLGI